MTSLASARWSVCAAALLFSTGGAAIKGTALSALQVSCFRSGIAALALALLLGAFPTSARVWLVGASYAGVVTLFVAGNKLTTAAHTIYLQSTAPLFAMLLSPWLLSVRPSRGDLLSAVALAAGLALLIGASPEPAELAPNPPLGNALAVLAGLCWALTLIGLAALARGAGDSGTTALDAAFAGNLLAFGLALPAALPATVQAGGLRLLDLASVAYLGLFQIALAYLLLVRGMRRLSAIEVSLLVLLEPLLNPFWSWWLHGETLSTTALVGCGLVLCASAQRIVLGRPPDPPARRSTEARV